MTLLHRIGAICLLAVAATLGPAPTAAADLVPPADGYYVYSEPGKPAAYWTMQALCVQASGTRAQEDYTDTTIQTLGCTLLVSSKTEDNFTPDEALLNMAGRSRLTGGQWTFTNTAARLVCPDGSNAPVTDNFAFDQATLTGTRTTIWDAVCGRQPGMTKTPFTLAFAGPLDPPVDNRFPPMCDYLAGRPSICS
ncbi:hypothetical protein [Mycolicibacterium confluentis]|uniref:Uncharacterized protein n=1 Tax=Mycolicibacterium confluentis TaxID=28047 RepID=A0A7I7XXF4_9MYCO|nr:hypothetical protein [Mycolicibacterium confluentis]MCV7318450.1 hypothetical protein [Mycolicibacterium confluentis]ORV20276.1 hypothetical protein AWB99_07465 [Mycolicibacterium confluentis]BBZ34010.1 hypothetical protein MCNF_26150 [Mycolicibacterium confluentis]